MHAAIVVPQTAHNYDDAVEMAVKELADRYGEVHTVDVEKWYTDRDDELESGPATRIEVTGNVHQAGVFTMIAERIRELTDLRAVMYVVDGERTVV